MIVVAASSPTDHLSSHSNYGPNTVHLAAPGENIVTLAGTDGTSMRPGTTTSFAAPSVAGAAALVLSRCPMNTSALKMLLLDSADRPSQLAGYTMTGGRLNVENALRTCAPNAPAAPPAISLTTPLDRTSYPTSAAIKLQALASDTDGSIARVEFYADSALIGTDTAPPYTATWTTTSAGSHVLTAIAIDDTALQTVSSAVSVTIAATAAASPCRRRGRARMSAQSSTSEAPDSRPTHSSSTAAAPESGAHRTRSDSSTDGSTEMARSLPVYRASRTRIRWRGPA
jgi:subtilisin family serine protease